MKAVEELSMSIVEFLVINRSLPKEARNRLICSHAKINVHQRPILGMASGVASRINSVPHTAAFGLGVVIGGSLGLVPDPVSPAFLILILVFFGVFVYGDMNSTSSDT